MHRRKVLMIMDLLSMSNHNLPRRMMGPVRKSMGGSAEGPGFTITNNVSGYILKATGTPSTIDGTPQLRYTAQTNTLSASANLYISGSGNYLFLHGTDSNGNPAQFKVEIDGSLLKIIN